MLTRPLIDLIKEDLGLGKEGLAIPAGSPVMKSPGMPPMGGPPLGGAKGVKVPNSQPKLQKTVSSVISPTNAPGGNQAAGRQLQGSVVK